MMYIYWNAVNGIINSSPQYNVTIGYQVLTPELQSLDHNTLAE